MYETKRAAPVAFTRRLCLTTSVLALCAAISLQPAYAQTRTYVGGENNATALDTAGVTWSLENTGSSIATQSGVISGTGAISIVGAGSLRLSGANTYSGGTLMSGATKSLAIAHDEALGTGALTLQSGYIDLLDVSVANDIVLDYAPGTPATAFVVANGSSTLSGVISGTGKLFKALGGNLTLTGANTFAGGTEIAGGSVTVGNNSAFGSGSVVLRGSTSMVVEDGITVANAMSIVANVGTSDVTVEVGNGTGRLNGVIGGDGRLVKTGAGRLELGGANFFTGGAWLRGGTVALYNVDNLGTGLVRIENTMLQLGNGIFLENNVVLGDNVVLASEGTGTIEGDLVGTGGFTVAGGNTVALSGINTFTGRVVITDGTLSVLGVNSLNGQRVYVDNGGTLEFVEDNNNDNQFYTLASLDGGGNVSFDGRRLTVGGNNADMEFSGTFFELGQFTKVGTGTMTITSSFLDLTHKEPLTLGRFFVVDGKLVNRGTIANGAVIGEGQAILTGDGLYPRLIASQTSTIAPGEATNSIGTVRADWVEFREDATYEVNIASDGRSDFIDSRFASLAGTVVVKAAGGDYGQAKQYHILEASQSIDIEGGDITRFAGVTTNLFFYDATLTYDPNNVWLNLARNGRTFDQISGITPNQRAVAPILEAFGVGNPLYDNIVSGSEADGFEALDELSGELHAGVGTALTGQSQLVQDAVFSRLRQPFSSLVDGSFAALGYADDGKAASSTDGWTFTPWTQAFGGFQQFNSNGNADDLKQGTGGVLFGVDGTLDNRFRLGVAGGASSSHVSGDAGPSSADITSFHVAGYGAAELDALALRFGAAYSWNTVNTKRDAAFGAFADQTLAKYGAHTGQVFGEIGYKLAVGQVMLEPFGGLAVVGVGSDSFSETGGASALNGSGFTQSTAFTTVGLRGNWTLNATEAGILSSWGGIGWRHAFNANPAVRDLAFASGGPTFQVAGVPVAADSFVLEAGLDFEANTGLTVGVNYAGQLAGNSQSHTVKAGLGFSF